MGIIREQTKHPDFPATLEVIEREPGEMVEAWRIADLNLEWTGERFTPRELRELGHWLVKEGKRLGREFKSSGAPRAV